MRDELAAHNDHNEAHNVALVTLECNMQAQVAALQVKQDARSGAQTAPLAQLERQLGTELETLSSTSEEHAALLRARAELTRGIAPNR